MEDFLRYTATSDDSVLFWFAYASLFPMVAVLVCSYCRAKWVEFRKKPRATRATENRFHYSN